MAEVLYRGSAEDILGLKAESATGMNVVTQLGLVYFCSFARTGPLDDVL